MSATVILTPIVIAAWPAISAAALAAATSMGFTLIDEARHAIPDAVPDTGRVELEIPGSEVITSSLGRDQRLRVIRDGVIATFGRDARGRASICVTGPGHTDEELRAIGEALGGRMVQQFVLQKLRDELALRGMNIVDENVEAGDAVRLTVRHWQN